MQKKVRMSDIAQSVGVSTVTVSKALSGKEGVSDAVREKILKVAMEMGYQIKSDTKKPTDGVSVGILVFDCFVKVNSSFYWSLYERLLAHLRAHNMFGILEVVNKDDVRTLSTPLLVQSERVQALILMGTMDKDYLHMIQQNNLPTVQLDSCDVRFNWDAVISDGYYGMYIMTDYLIRKGHREIAYLGRVGRTGSITDRYFGYSRALMENGIPLRQEWVISDRDDLGYSQITLPERIPTAFVCNCDVVAYNLILLLNERGLQVPEDVSVVGFDNYCFPELQDFRITTYAVDMDNMAKASIEQLVQRFTSPHDRKQLQIIAGYLVEKSSVHSLS